MNIRIHPLQPDDFAATEALLLAAASERKECVRDWSHTSGEPDDDGYIRRDYIAVDADDPQQVIGYGAIWPQGRGRFRMDLVVAQTCRRQGVGTTLLHHLMQTLQAQRAIIVQARTPDFRLESLAFLARNGFTETNRMIRLQLSVAQASISTLQPLRERLAARGIIVVTLEQAQTQAADWLPRVLDMIRATMPERVANPYRMGCETELCSLEDAAQTWESYRPLNGTAFFLARWGSRYLGMTHLAQGETEKHLQQGDTGVHTEWRRQGIATLLKLHAIAYAQENGYDSISTYTANPNMLALNERMGFEQEMVEVRMVKEVGNG